MNKEISVEITNSLQYFLTLDGWRALVIILVMFHYSSDNNYNTFGSVSAGFAGFFNLYVQFSWPIFFAISGFLIWQDS